MISFVNLRFFCTFAGNFDNHKQFILKMKVPKKPGFQRFLDGVEVAGNKLPHPAMLFALFALIIIVISHIAAAMGVSVRLPGAEVDTYVRGVGIAYIFTNAVSNFVNFAPLGTVLVAMLGVGVAEHTGLISALLRKIMLGSSKKMITIVVVFVGIFSSIAENAGYLIVIPLGAAIFYAIGRHPLAGLAAAFFGVSAGFAANISLTLSDVILAGITEQAAQMIDPDIVVLATSNIFFMWAATIILTIIGYFVTEKIVVPKLGEYKPDGEIDVADISSELSVEEKRGLKFAGWSFLGAVAFLLLLVLPESAPLRNPETGAILDRDAPFMGGLVAVIMILFLAPALGFGIGSKTIKGNKDVVNSMTKSMQSMGAYLVLAFFAAQFINYFAHSNLGVVLSMNGSVFLQNTGLTGVPLILSFVLLCAFLNMFMGSSSAKWLIMAPIFVPMFMQLGYDPAFTQLAFRVGDTVTNIITPMMSFFALVVVFAEKYDKNAGIGTIISMMLPYSLIALLGLSAALIIWYLTGLPIGIGGYIHLPS